MAIPAGRGTIVDRMGVQLAIGEEAVTVYANPRQVTSPRAGGARAAKTLGVDADVLYPQLLDKSKGFIYIVRKADPERRRRCEKRSLAGRRLPGGGAAGISAGGRGCARARLCGHRQPRPRRARAAARARARGREGSETFVKDPFGRVLNVVESSPERPGRDVFLRSTTRSRRTSSRCSRSTCRSGAPPGRRRSCSTRRAGASSRWRVAPGFDANDYARTPADRHRNVAVTDTYEPGSTFKLVTVAAALSEGLVNARQPVHAALRRSRSRTGSMHDAEPRGTETMTVAQILARSSNVGAITLAQLLGPAAARSLDRPLRVRRSRRESTSRRDARHRAAGRAAGPAPRSATSLSARASR